ncbi:lipid-A-disaccharide synthase [Thiolapillus sp.]|uniref:lipid-A-disaccharide synthase n=1 Tax=Thiolapillus sp. TaxID=2017437 RepID=UPI0025E339BE|nr:lipid-A-disaccharide synthase [Thiolapillus sp.]
MRIGIVAAEPSGDQLAAGLMRELQKQHPQVTFEGIGGPQMTALGLQGWFPMERLSVMGLVEVLGRLPELLKIRKTLIRRWKRQPPDLFIGVDAPDFNLKLETTLKTDGVPTVHYVSPTVWAWRQKRIHKIRAAADLVLSIFPFEHDFLARHGVPCTYVGHPLAHRYPLQPDKKTAREQLGLSPDVPVLALLPGSRGGEVQRLARPFLQTAAACASQLDRLKVVSPLATDRTEAAFRQACEEFTPELDIMLTRNNTAQVLTAADVVLVASGTATFEALLCKRPMVVGYKVNPLTYRIIMGLGMLRIEHVAMANLLSEAPLAPEFIQQACEPEKLLPAVLNFFGDAPLVQGIFREYTRTHESLIMETDTLAAGAVLNLWRERSND